jgi:hypothetical protein
MSKIFSERLSRYSGLGGVTRQVSGGLVPNLLADEGSLGGSSLFAKVGRRGRVSRGDAEHVEMWQIRR